MTAYFVAGAHTDIGKTHVACALLRAARTRGLSVGALKPVVSGLDARDWSQSDPGRLLTALGRPLETPELDAISPWRFVAPLAPPMAARREGRALGLEDIETLCRARLGADRCDLFLLEGVGGVMSPIADGATGLELMKRLGLPALLVGGGYLGAVSHTLSALETLRAHGVQIAAVAVSQDADPGAPDFSEQVDMVAAFSAAPVFAAPRGTNEDWAIGLLEALLAAPV